MSIILPYNELLSKNGGSFIKPNGEIIPAYGKHENIAYNYCTGSSMILGNSYSLTPYIYSIYHNSQLNEEEYQLYQLWLSHHKDNNIVVSDFLTLVLGFDKVEKVTHNAITTSSYQPHIRFYNYYLMDWDITILPKYYYDSDKNTFMKDDYFYTRDYKDLEATEEIEEIKSKVKKKDRAVFFK